MFKTPLRRFKRHLSQFSSHSVNPRTHFPGKWGRRELKESPTHGAKLGISPVKLFSKAKCQSANVIAVHSDTYALFYCYHLMYAEELFYGHMALLVIMAKGDARYLTKSLKANRNQSLEITKFKFIKQLGTGAFGTVYLAEHPTRKKLVAVKKVLATDVAYGVDHAIRTLVEKEASCHSQGSPHVIQLLDTFSVSRGSLRAFYFVYEYADGGDLSHLITRIHYGKNQIACSLLLYEGEFSDLINSNGFIIPFTKYLGAQILLGVVALHERGIIHLDLKPDNILITKYGIVKIADLGMVKRYRWFHYSARATFLTDVHTEVPNIKHEDSVYVGGTIMFMEPELRGKFIREHTSLPVKFNNTITFSADYFAVGLIIFNILTGFVYGYSAFIDELQMLRLKSILRASRELIQVAWYIFKHDIMDDVRIYMDQYSIDNMTKLTRGLDQGVVSLLRTTLQSRSKRWNKFTIPVKVKRDDETVEEDILCITKIKKQIQLFKHLDFEGISVNGLPEFLADFMKPQFVPSNDFLLAEDLAHELQPPKNDLYAWPYFEYHMPTDDEISNEHIDSFNHKVNELTDCKRRKMSPREQEIRDNYMEMKEIDHKQLSTLEDEDIQDFFKENSLILCD